MKAPRSGDSSEVARSLLVECVVKGLNGAGECVVSEMELVML